MTFRSITFLGLRHFAIAGLLAIAIGIFLAVAYTRVKAQGVPTISLDEPVSFPEDI